MRLAAAAKHFDKQVFTDAYGAATLKGQLDLYDDSKRDSAAAGRRILSVAPAVVMPARRVLRLGEYSWIVGKGSPDYYKSNMIRRKFTLHEADGLATVSTLSQYLAATGGLSAYAAAEWVKAAKEIDESSDLTDVLGAIVASTEILPDVGIMELAGKVYLLREPYLTSGGFQGALLDEVKAPAKELGSFVGGVYEPVSDTSTTTTTAVNMIRLSWQTHFKYLSQKTLTFQTGDDVLICLKSAVTPKANDKVTLADGIWQVLTVQTDKADSACWSLHARRVPV